MFLRRHSEMFVDNCFFLYEDDMNYALSRPASQSSTHKNFVAGKAVDGISYDESSLSHTLAGGYHPWWKVEFIPYGWHTWKSQTDYHRVRKCRNTTQHEQGIIYIMRWWTDFMLFWCIPQFQIEIGNELQDNTWEDKYKHVTFASSTTQ